MAFTMESIETPLTNKGPVGPNEFDLPVKEFIGYDTKKNGTSPSTENTKQENIPVRAAEPPAQKEESVTLSSKMSAIARADMAARKKEAALVAREKALEAKLADADKFAQLKAKLAAKDYSAADELGMTYEEYTQHLLNKQAETDPNETRFRQLEEKLNASEKASEEKELKEYETNQALWKQEISKLVSENSEFSTIKELKMEDAVLRHVNDSFEEDGIELTAEQAAKEIEDALVERAEKFASVTKIKQKFEATAPKLGPPKTAPKTITQNMTVSSERTSSKPFYLMSESEQLAEAFRRVQMEKLQR